MKISQSFRWYFFTHPVWYSVYSLSPCVPFWRFYYLYCVNYVSWNCCLLLFITTSTNCITKIWTPEAQQKWTDTITGNGLPCPKIKTLKFGRNEQTLSRLMVFHVPRSRPSSPVEVNRPDVSLGEAHVGDVSGAQSNTTHQTSHYR